MWDSSLWKVDVLRHFRYFVHIKVSWKNEVDWLLIVVYGSPKFQYPQDLRDNLSKIAVNVECEWVIVEDFNFVLHAHEKGGSGLPSLRGIPGFQHIL